MLELLQILALLTSSGVLAGGVGVLKWGLSIERRLTVVEVKTGVNAPSAG